MEGRKEGRLEEWKDERKEGRMEDWKDGIWKEGRKEGKKEGMNEYKNK